MVIEFENPPFGYQEINPLLDQLPFRGRILLISIKVEGNSTATLKLRKIKTGCFRLMQSIGKHSEVKIKFKD